MGSLNFSKANKFSFFFTILLPNMTVSVHNKYYRILTTGCLLTVHYSKYPCVEQTVFFFLHSTHPPPIQCGTSKCDIHTDKLYRCILSIYKSNNLGGFKGTKEINTLSDVALLCASVLQLPLDFLNGVLHVLK